MSNLTVDDAAPTLSYGPGWGVASSDDAALSQYFLSTYHASETPGAVVNLSFSGSATALYVYGSKGPNRGTFSVRYDGDIQHLSAHADKLQYRQLLFTATLTPIAKPHTFTLNNTSSGQGPNWVDLDFLTITDGNTSAVNSGPSSTISPLPVPSGTAASSGSDPLNAPGSQTSPTDSSTPSTSTSHPSSNDATRIIAIVFGVILFLILSGIAAYLIMRRLRAADAKQRPPSRASSSITGLRQTPGSAFLDTGLAPTFTYQQHVASTPPQSTLERSDAHARFDAIAPFKDAEPEPDMREGSAVASSSVGHSSYGNSRPWSPLTSPIKAFFGTAKDGADSMKSTFLKV